MTLQEIFDLLQQGELSQMSLGTSDGVSIGEEHQARVIGAVNRALTELHKRFALRVLEVPLQMQVGTSVYWIDPKYAVSTGGTAPKYLLDASQPLEKLIRVEQIFDAEGCELAMNHKGDLVDQSRLWVRMPTYNCLVLPPDLATQTLKVMYRANHAKLEKTPGFFDPSQVQVDIPDVYLEALLLHVASTMTNPAGPHSGNAGFHEGNNYWARFEAACQLLQDQEYRNQETTENYRLYRNGWV